MRPVYRTAVALATLAREQAVQAGDCDPDEAWACGLLAPLGWLGVCAADPAAAAACLADPKFALIPLKRSAATGAWISSRWPAGWPGAGGCPTG